MKRPIQQPRLETERLYLRAFSAEDAPRVQQLAGQKEIADTTVAIPHPYSEAQAREWIVASAKARSDGRGYTFALERKEDRMLLGAVGLREITPQHLHGELGFWIGLEWWGQGYATEAARAVLRYGFEGVKLNRIYAFRMERNPASGKVMEKIGMQKEGYLRQAVRKWDRFEDVVLYAILQEDWSKLQGSAS